MVQRKYQPVQLPKETYNRLTEICRKSGFPKSKLLSMLINEIYILTAKVDDFNLVFNTNLPEDYLKIITQDRKIRAIESQAETAKQESRFSPVVKEVRLKGD